MIVLPAVKSIRKINCLSLLFFIFLARFFATAQVSVTTYHNDNARTGQNLQETVLTPANVNVSGFGKLFTYSIQPASGIHAYSYAEPLYVPNVTINGVLHNVIYVVTERNQVFAFDADGTQTTPLWSKQFETPISPNASQNYIADTLGIQSTPVIDVSTNTMYFVSNTTDSSGNNVQKLHGVDITTGSDKFGGPVIIQANVPGTAIDSTNGTIHFNANVQNQRPALLLSNGLVYVTEGSYDDNSTYHGWVISYNASTLAQTGVFNSTPNSSNLNGASVAAGSIWTLSGPAADQSGNLFVGVANGDTDSLQNDFGDSYVKLSSSLGVLDYFTAYDWKTLSNNDQDLNGGGPLLLPDQAGTGTHPHLLVWGSKGGKIYLVDRDNMGHLSTTSSDSQIVQSFQAWTASSCAGDDGSCVRTLPAYWNNTVYFIPQNYGPQAYSLSNGLLSTSPVSQEATTPYPLRGATPSISANGSTAGILWAVKVDADTTGTGKPSTLYAYDASDVSKILYSSNDNATRDALTPAQNFTVPLVVNGKVYVATRDNLIVYGLLNPPPTVQLTANPTTITAGQSSTLIWSSTNATSVTISGVGTFGASGSITVTPSSTTTYTATATGSAGSATASATVTVGSSSAAPTVQLTANPTTITAGQSSTLTWSSTNATSVTISGVGTFGASGSTTVTPSSTTTYTATATGSGGSATASTTVTVQAAPPTVQLSASPTSITAGQSSTLSWSSTDATSVTISGVGTFGASGSTTVTLSSTTTYTATATGSGGSATASTTVTVQAAPPTVQLSASPTSITAGQSSTLSWSSTDATSVTISGVGTFGASGSTTVTLSSTTTYTATATGSGGSATASTTVTVQAAAPTVQISASPTTITAGQSSTLTWSSTNATSVTISGVGTFGASGSTTVTPSSTTTYTATASGSGGSVTASTSVTVQAPAPTVQLSASPTSITAGQSSTLTWSSTNATSVTISGVGTFGASGSTTVTPSSTTTYTATASGSGGSATASTTVTVQASAPPPTSCTAGPPPSVTVCAPTNGSTVSSPVQFLAAASATNGISAMAIYVDDTLAYGPQQGASINTSLTLTSGTHHVTVQAWENAATETVDKTSLTITVSP